MWQLLEKIMCQGQEMQEKKCKEVSRKRERENCCLLSPKNIHKFCGEVCSQPMFLPDVHILGASLLHLKWHKYKIKKQLCYPPVLSHSVSLVSPLFLSSSFVRLFPPSSFDTSLPPLLVYLAPSSLLVLTIPSLSLVFPRNI